MKKMLWSVVMGCALGCTGLDGGSGGEALSTGEPPDETDPQQCEVVCSPYDPADCQTVCPTPPPDAAIPEDPYSDPAGEPSDPAGEPPPRPADAGAPHDPYALGGATDGDARGHRAC